MKDDTGCPKLLSPCELTMKSNSIRQRVHGARMKFILSVRRKGSRRQLFKCKCVRRKQEEKSWVGTFWWQLIGYWLAFGCGMSLTMSSSVFDVCVCVCVCVSLLLRSSGTSQSDGISLYFTNQMKHRETRRGADFSG